MVRTPKKAIKEYAADEDKVEVLLKRLAYLSEAAQVLLDQIDSASPTAQLRSVFDGRELAQLWLLVQEEQARRP